MSFFPKEIPLLKEDKIFASLLAYQKDPRPEKMNLGIGIYRNEEALSLPLPSVLAAEQRVKREASYLSAGGDENFLRKAIPFALGEESYRQNKDALIAFQSLGATGALALIARFIKDFMDTPVFIPHSSWPNHLHLFSMAGLQCKSYPYLDTSHQFDCEALLDAFAKIPEHSFVLLHSSCHNPSGQDPSPEQWKTIAELIKQKRLRPIFDCAYQGFAQEPEDDNGVLQLFIQKKIEFFLAYSFSKNFSMYGERLGFCLMYCEQKSSRHAFSTNLKSVARALYSNPPRHASDALQILFSSVSLFSQWKNELRGMRKRIAALRETLTQGLENEGINLPHLKTQKGLFAYLALDESQVEKLKKEHAIYLGARGRLNLAGLSFEKLPRLISALCSLLKP